MTERILVVDNVPANLKFAEQLLEHKYRLTLAIKSKSMRL